MDFNDTAEESAFRAEARKWLEANAALRTPDDPMPEALPETISQAEIDDMQENPRWPKLDHIAQGKQGLRIR